MSDKPESDDSLAPVRQRMARLLDVLAPTEGYNLTVLEDVRLLRSNRPLSPCPCCTTPAS